MRGSFLLFFALESSTLERVRSDPALASDPKAIDELVREADVSPPSAMRADAWALAAEAYAHRLGRPADAERLDRKIADDPAADPVVRRKAKSDLVGLLVDRGALDEAASVASGEESLEKTVRVQQRMHHFRLAAFAVLGILLAAALHAFARGTRARVAPALRRLAPLAVGYAAYVALTGALLASKYEPGTGRPFLLFGLALFPLLLVARSWSAAGASSSRARIGRAAICAAGVASAAFLAYVEGTKQ